MYTKNERENVAESLVAIRRIWRINVKKKMTTTELSLGLIRNI